MKSTLTPMRACIVAALSLMLLSCGGGAAEKVDPAVKAGAELAGFVEAYFNAYFTFSPSEASSAGLHDPYDRQLEERTVGRIQARVTELKAQLQQLEAIRKQPLNASDGVDAALLASRVQGELHDLDTLKVWRSPLYYAGIPGNSIDVIMKRSYDTPAGRLSSVTARLRQITPLLDAMRDNFQDTPKEFLDLSVRILKGSIPFFQTNVAAWGQEAAGKDLQALSEFQQANRRAVGTLEVMLEHLERNGQRMATGKYAIGEANFLAKLKYDEMVEIPLDKLLAIGQARLEQDHKAFIEVARQVAPGRSPADAMAVLEAQHPTEASQMEYVKNTLEKVREFVVSKNIIPIPSEERARVEATPPYARSGSFASMDTPGAYERQAREAFYYVTPPEKEWTAAHKEEHLKLYNKPVLDLINIHEAYPGHYTQFLYAKQFPTKVRKLISASSNAEGWAHYAEQMMVEEGFGSGDAKIRLAQLAEALVRDARYVAGIRLHTAGWTVEDATKLFAEQAFMQRANAFEEARRGTYNPTYLYYTLGKMQIYKLREDYKQAKGSAYSLTKFHEDFVKQGSIPVRLIRQILLPGNAGSDL